MLFLSLFLLSACSDNIGISDVSENSIDILSTSITDKPVHGDIFIIQNKLGEQIIYAYMEKDSEIDVDETYDNVLNIHFKEPGENEDYILYTLEVQGSLENSTINFYLNGEENSAEVIYE